MTITIINCNRCGVRIEVERMLVTVETGAIRARWPALDFCQSCATEFVSWIEQERPAAEVVPGTS